MIDINEPNVTIIKSEHEANSARYLAGRMFMDRLAPTAFTVKPEYQMKWWGFLVDEKKV